jgi:hypothetical protein
MSEFRTIIPVKKSTLEIAHQSKLMLMGSCFAENMGDRLLAHRFDSVLNPFGILYNPSSIALALDKISHNYRFEEADLFEFDGRYHSYLHHGRFSNIDQKICLAQINQELALAYTRLKTADYLFITFGSSWVFKLAESDTVVGNCHKVPAKKFVRTLLKLNDIVDEYQKLLDKLLKTNANLNIVFTVSPVRHLKDGAHGNQISKSILLLAVEELTNNYKQCQYFPSYELIMDDLRDYRFYNSDMTHINETGIEYIWDYFCKTYLNQDTLKMLPETGKMAKSLNHILNCGLSPNQLIQKSVGCPPSKPLTEKDSHLIKSIITKMKNLQTKYNLDYSMDIRILSQLA